MTIGRGSRRGFGQGLAKGGRAGVGRSGGRRAYLWRRVISGRTAAPPLADELFKFGSRTGALRQGRGDDSQIGRLARHGLELLVAEAATVQKLTKADILIEDTPGGLLHLGAGLDAQLLTSAEFVLEVLKIILSAGAGTALVVANAGKVRLSLCALRVRRGRRGTGWCGGGRRDLRDRCHNCSWQSVREEQAEAECESFIRTNTGETVLSVDQSGRSSTSAMVQGRVTKPCRRPVGVEQGKAAGRRRAVSKGRTDGGSAGQNRRANRTRWICPMKK